MLAVRDADVDVFRGKASNGATSIHVGGLASSLIFKEPREAFLQVSSGMEIKALGYASGNSRWTVICDLPRDQFVDLLAIVLAGRLSVVEMDFNQLKWNRGTLEAIEFGTRALGASN
ncbi:protein of unknown function [Hyphomicrobium sp. 1Nfss2.1]